MKRLAFLTAFWLVVVVLAMTPVIAFCNPPMLCGCCSPGAPASPCATKCSLQAASDFPATPPSTIALPMVVSIGEVFSPLLLQQPTETARFHYSLSDETTRTTHQPPSDPTRAPPA